MSTPLSDLPPGGRGIIREIGPQAPERLRELGFAPGTEVSVIRVGPFGNPVEVELRGYRLCLRRSELLALTVDPVEGIP